MKNIAVIAHDAKKEKLAEFVENHREWILGTKIVATGKTAEFLETKNIEVKHLSRGRYGGYNQLTEMVKKGEIDLIIFFIDPDVDQPHHEDISRLLKAARHYDIPLATNPSSAELIIIGLIKKEEAEKAMEFIKKKQ
ncbi:MAG: methylglyoxal synthase [Marinilabiliales bacterium]